MPGRPLNSTPRDLGLQAFQLFRDLGPGPQLARQVAKMLVHLVAPRFVPGRVVEGIRRLPETDFSMAVPFGYGLARPSAPPPRVAAICHVFHPELAGELRQVLANIPVPFATYLSTDSEPKRDAILESFRGWDSGLVEMRLVANRGRDIAPKLTAFPEVYGQHDLILFLHTKQNTNVIDGGDWRRHLFRNLAGSPAVVASVLEAFAADPDLGMVIPQHFGPIRPWIGWGGEFNAARVLARRMGLSLSSGHVIDFPSGSMFWARPAALRPMLDLGMTPFDFPPEDGKTRGTVAHAIEHLFLFACEIAGFRWMKICDPATADLPDTVVPISSALDLARYRTAHDFRLIASPSRAPPSGTPRTWQELPGRSSAVVDDTRPPVHRLP